MLLAVSGAVGLELLGGFGWAVNFRSVQMAWRQCRHAISQVRTLVFRGWADDAVLDLLTDGRNAKHAQFWQQHAVQLCWRLTKARCQFRLRGGLLTLPSRASWEARCGIGRASSPRARSLWG